MRWLSVPPETTTGALLGERGGQQLGVDDRLALVVAVLVGGGELEGHGLGGDDVHQRAALGAGEDALVDGLAQVLAAEDQAAARAAQGLVSGGRDDVGVAERARVEAGRDESGDVGHVHHQERVHAWAILPNRSKSSVRGIGAGAGHDQLGLDLGRLLLEGVVVDLLGLRVDAVGVDLVPLAAEVDRRAVGEVAAVGQVHAENPVARSQDER
jgi:hypothetical protein